MSKLGNSTRATCPMCLGKETVAPVGHSVRWSWCCRCGTLLGPGVIGWTAPWWAGQKEAEAILHQLALTADEESAHEHS